jgi:hypothetical protein
LRYFIYCVFWGFEYCQPPTSKSGIGENERKKIRLWVQRIHQLWENTQSWEWKNDFIYKQCYEYTVCRKIAFFLNYSYDLMKKCRSIFWYKVLKTRKEILWLTNVKYEITLDDNVQYFDPVSLEI